MEIFGDCAVKTAKRRQPEQWSRVAERPCRAANMSANNSYCISFGHLIYNIYDIVAVGYIMKLMCSYIFLHKFGCKCVNTLHVTISLPLDQGRI